MTFIHSWPFSWLSSIILQVNASVMEGLVYTYMGNSVASLTGSEAAIPARASACTLSAHGLFSMVHSPNHYRVSLILLDITSCARPWLRIPPVRVSQRVENHCRFGAWRWIV